MSKFLKDYWTFFILACGVHIFVSSLLQIYENVVIGFIAILVINLVCTLFTNFVEHLIYKYKSKKRKNHETINLVHAYL